MLFESVNGQVVQIYAIMRKIGRRRSNRDDVVFVSWSRVNRIRGKSKIKKSRFDPSTGIRQVRAPESVQQHVKPNIA